MNMLISSYILCTVLLLSNFVIFYTGLKIIVRNKNNSSKDELKAYYYGKKGKIKYVKEEDHIMLIFDGFWLIFRYLIILFFSYGIVMVIYSNTPNIWSETGKYIDEIPQLMISTFLGVYAVIGIAIAINKKHFITFSIIDIFEIYKIKNTVLKMIMLICSTYIIFYISIVMRNINIPKYYFPFKSLIFINFILFLYNALRVCWIAGSIFTSNPPFELKALDHLYENFYYTDIKIDTDKWDVNGVKYIMENLMKAYKEALKKISLTELKDVKFVSVMKEIKEIKFLYYKAVIYYYSYFCIMFSIFTFTLSMQIHFKLIFSIFILCLIMCIITCSVQSLRIVATIILYGRCGYAIKYNNKRIKYKKKIPFIMSKWMNYVYAIQNILAFYKIAINKTYINKEEHEEAEKTIANYIANNMQEIDDLGILISLILYIKYEKVKTMSEMDEDYQIILSGGLAEKIIDQKIILYQVMNAIISDVNRDVKIKEDKTVELRNEKLDEFRRELRIKRKANN